MKAVTIAARIPEKKAMLLRLSVLIALLLPLALPPRAEAGNPRCSLVSEPSRLNAEEARILKVWEDEYLATFPIAFQRAWRGAVHRVRYRWVLFELRARGSNAAAYRAALGEIRSSLVLEKAILSLPENFPQMPAAARFAGYIRKLRAEVPIVDGIHELDVVGTRTGPIDLGDLSQSRLHEYFRPHLTRPLESFIAVEGDRPSDGLPSGAYDGATGLSIPMRDIVPWGSVWRSDLTREEAFYLRIRDIEEKILRIQREEGQIDDEVPELLAGDRLDPDQVVLYTLHSSVPMSFSEFRDRMGKWIASGRLPYPIAQFVSPNASGPVPANDSMGSFDVTDAVLRLARNFRLPNGEAPAAGAKLEFVPLDGPTGLSPARIAAQTYSVEAGGFVKLRYKLGRAYGRAPYPFAILTLVVVEKIVREIIELQKRFSVVEALVEAHAGSRRNAEYYMQSYGFRKKPGAPWSETDWNLVVDLESLIAGVRRQTDRARPAPRPSP